MPHATDWEWTLLDAGTFRLDGGSMFGVVPKAVWSKLVEPDASNRIPLTTNCVLLQRDGQRVLIETGYGEKWTERDRAIFALQPRTIVDALHEVGIEPEAIDLVIVTHLHFDHAGGLTHLDERGEPISTFPRATIVAQRTEWEDALANKSTMTKTYLRSHLDPIAGQVSLVDGDAAIRPGLFVWPLPGHTWGHQAVRFETEDGVVCFAGDVVPTVNHAGPAFNMGYDMLPHTNMGSKQTLLGRAAAESWRLVIDHEPEHPLVTVQGDEARPGRYELSPLSLGG